MPRTTRTRTVGSPARAAKWSVIARHMSIVTALRFSGRLSHRVAIAPSWVTSTSTSAPYRARLVLTSAGRYVRISRRRPPPVRFETMTNQIPFVDYLVLDDEPHLVANECTSCGARFFDRRNACASCFATEFRDVPIGTDGEVRSFTIVTLRRARRAGAVRGRRGRLRRHERARQPRSTSSPTPSTSRSA